MESLIGPLHQTGAMGRWCLSRTLALLTALVVLAGCVWEPVEPSVGVPVTIQDWTPGNACERAVVTRAEFIRDHGAAGSEALESDIFRTCTYAEFLVANSIMADDYRYPGDGRQYVGRNCVRLFSLYRGSRLCETRDP